jgi:predicted permease
MGKHLREVLRRLGRAPLFTLITVVTLAAAIAANTVIFGVVEGVLVKPLPYPHPEQLVGVWHTAPGFNLEQLSASPSNYFIYRDQSQSFQDIALLTDDSDSVTGTGQPEQVRALDVTDGLLPILGIPPMLGRWFNQADDSPGAPATVMLTYGYWQQKFGGDPSIIGRSITVDGKPRQIIGVMPQRFHFLDEQDPALLTPLQLDRGKTHLGNFSYRSIARLKPGVTIQQASADVSRMLPIVMKSFSVPEGFSLKLFEDAHVGPSIHPLKQDVIGDVQKVLWILMGAIALVLVIACANVANLQLVRVEGRKSELAIRTVLGAGWRRIAADLLLESVVLGLLGSLGGIVIAYGALRVLIAIAPSGLPRIHEIGIDRSVLLFTLAISLFAGLLCAIIPIFKYAGGHLSTGLRPAGRTHSQSREQHRARSVLVVAQVAMALLLLICSGLMIRTFRALVNVNPGFSGARDVQTFEISIPTAQVPDPEKVTRMFEEIENKIRAIPGVTSIGASSTIPMDEGGSFDPIFVQNYDYKQGQLPPLRNFKFITPGYTETMKIPLIAGRSFEWNDVYKRVPVAMVSENLAREYWNPPSAALGKRIRVGTNDDWREIVGVIGNVYDQGVEKEAPTSVYWPLLMARYEGEDVSIHRTMKFAVRSPRTGSESFMAEIRSAVWSVNANLPLAEIHTVDYFYQKSLARTSFTLIVLALSGGMALLLGIVGIYGVIAYSVSQRIREIGIRIALGAQQRAVTGMFVRHGLILAAIGVTIGLAAAAGLMRLMSSILFKVKPTDPVTYFAGAAIVIITAWLASYLPSRRAATVDPAEALRAE